jgi:hypothetical protein
MAVTRLQRKAKRNKLKAAQRQAQIKQLLSKPVIKNIDIDKIKTAFLHKNKEKTTSSAES